MIQTELTRDTKYHMKNIVKHFIFPNLNCNCVLIFKKPALLYLHFTFISIPISIYLIRGLPSNMLISWNCVFVALRISHVRQTKTPYVFSFRKITKSSGNRALLSWFSQFHRIGCKANLTSLCNT